MRIKALVVLLVCLVGAVAFAATMQAAPGTAMVNPEDVSLERLSSIPASRWQPLTQKRVLFGHQSVGSNILDGIKAICGLVPAIRLEIENADEKPAGASPRLAECSIGGNGDPASKIRAFEAAVRRAGSGGYDIAFMKFCYLDIRSGTDTTRLFESYREEMARLRAEMPAMRLLHCTVPLTATRTGWKARLKRMFGGVPADDADNLARHRFNERMRAEYAAEGTLVDLAAAESTLPDGARVTWQTGEDRYECLAAAYTTDGGHLNAVGSRVVARAVLSRLEECVKPQ